MAIFFVFTITFVLDTLQITRRGDAANLTITGTGFVATSDLQCFYGNMKTELDTKFVSSTEIKCELPKRLTRKTGESKVFVSFAASKRGDDKNTLHATHHVGLPLPTVISAKVFFSFIFIWPCGYNIKIHFLAQLYCPLCKDTMYDDRMWNNVIRWGSLHGQLQITNQEKLIAENHTHQPQ